MSLPFGKRCRVGNYFICKKSRRVSREELDAIREASGLSKDTIQKLGNRNLPYYEVGTVGGNWSVTFAVGTKVFEEIDRLGEDEFNDPDLHDALKSLFSFWYSMTTVMTDEICYNEIIRSLDRWLVREAGRNKG